MMNKVIGVVAPKGSGKTTVVAELVRETPKVVVYDPMAETDMQYRVAASHIINHNLDELIRVLHDEENFQILYNPALPIQDGEEWRYPDFPRFLQIIWAYVRNIGPLMVVVDEAHYTMSKRTMPLEVLNIITNGRRYGLDIVWITQRFVGVNSWARANADEYWFFRLAHPADLNTVSEVAGPDVEHQVSELRRLDASSTPVVPGQLLIWSSLDGNVTVRDLAEEQNAGSKRTKENDRRIGQSEVPEEEPQDQGRLYDQSAASGPSDSGGGTK